MSILTLYTRSFHPRANFRTGGLFFHGDNRGFSGSPSATARIFHIIKINLKAARFEAVICDSDPSSNPLLTKETGLDFSNDYSQPEKKPRHGEDPKNITPYREDGNQNVNLRVQYAGKNFAFPFADGSEELEKWGVPKDTPHHVLGGEVSDGSNYTGASSFFPFELRSPVTFKDGIDVRSPVARTEERWSGAVPDLDVVNNVSVRINRDTKKADITCVITGDGFPNCESFLLDGANQLVFLASHVRTGTPITQLPGNRQIPMNNTSFVSDWEPGDIAGQRVSVTLCLDFTGAGASSEITKGAMSREAWNNAHVKRNPHGAYSQRVRDHVPLPQSAWVDDAINNNPEIVDGVRRARSEVIDAVDRVRQWWGSEE
ncbi:hypothetical protein ASD74_14535 [Rhizobium sp. Root564]|nr:hypothetical protein ASD74_14535 [Rhizobium sp. Root564]